MRAGFEYPIPANCIGCVIAEDDTFRKVQYKTMCVPKTYLLKPNAFKGIEVYQQ